MFKLNDSELLEVIKEVISYKNKHYPHVKILGAGGINKENVKEFVNIGVDGVVASQIYFCGMEDMGSKMEIL